MAFTSLTSIVTRYSSVKPDRLNAEDRAYLDECRRNSSTLFNVESNQLNSKPASNNQCYESFRVPQNHFVRRKIIRRHGWNWKQTLLLSIVMTIIVSSIITIACLFARDVQQSHYVQYFTLLILSIFACCLVVMIGSKLYPWIVKKCMNSESNQDEHNLESINQQAESTMNQT